VEQWTPAPQGMIAELVKRKWTSDNPAPKVVGYLWAWAIIHNGGSLSRRDLADYMGVSEWKARRLIEQVEKDYQNWGPPKTAQQPPKARRVTPNKSKELEPKAAHPPPPGLPSHARSLVNKYKSKSTLTKGPNKADLITPLWEEVNKIWRESKPGARALRLNKSRRSKLNQRLAESSPEEFIAVWRWRCTSSHGRAIALRKGAYGIDTVLRAERYEEYLDFSKELKVVRDKTQKPPPFADPWDKLEPELQAAYMARARAEAFKDMPELKAQLSEKQWAEAVKSIARGYIKRRRTA
jgi:hypothetical protein